MSMCDLKKIIRKAIFIYEVVLSINNSEVTNQNGQQGKRKNRFLYRCLTNLKSSLQKARKIFSVLFIIMERQSKSMTLILNRLFATMHNLQSSESAPNFAFRLFWVSYSSGMVLWVRTNLWVRNNLSELSFEETLLPRIAKRLKTEGNRIADECQKKSHRIYPSAIIIYLLSFCESHLFAIRSGFLLHGVPK